MKRYHDDPAKERSRMVVKKTLEDTLLGFRRPQDIRVLCFPGIDGMEVLQVYDQLGIPRQNIVGLERNERAANAIRDVLPGATIHAIDLKDYLAKEKSLWFDVVSLDFTQNLSSETIDLAIEVGSSVRAKNFVYHVAIQKRRESARTQDYMRYIQLQSDFARVMGESGLSPEVSDNKWDPDLDDDVSTLREHALKGIFLAAVTRSPHMSQTALLKGMLGNAYKAVFEHSKELYLKELANQGGTAEEIEDLMKAQSVEDTRFMAGMRNSILLSAKKLIHDSIEGQLLTHFADRVNLASLSTYRSSFAAVAHIVQKALEYSAADQAYCIKRLDKYAYISESGTPMIGDVAFFSGIDKLLDLYRDLLSNMDRRTMEIHNPNGLFKAFQKIKKFHEQQSGFRLVANDYNEVERQYLGSSAKPILRKEQAIELLRQGNEPTEIASMFRGANVWRVRAWKAHITMGTYEETGAEQDIAVQQDLKDDIETRVLLASEGVKVNGQHELDQEDALEYLKAGISPKEIHEAYPGTSVHKLVAWQFWLGKGKYEAKDETLPQ